MALDQPQARGKSQEQRFARVLKLIQELDVLPTTVNVPMRILQLQRSHAASAVDFAAALSADPSLTSKVLSLANSPYFAPRKPVTKISQAIAMIGLNNLLSLVFGLSMAGIFNKLSLPPNDVNGMWKGALLKSVAAQTYAQQYATEFSEEAALCGLLQDMALPVMYAADQAMWQMYCACLDAPPESRLEAEVKLYTVDHGRIGQLLGKRMGLPELFQNATAGHHMGVAVEKVTGNLGFARALQFAAALPHKVGESPHHSAAKLRQWMPPAETKAIEDRTLTALLDTIGRNYKNMLTILGEYDDASVAFKDFLRDVSGEVARSTVSAIGESAAQITTLRTRENELEQHVQSLEQQAIKSDYDALTGILNRAGWVGRCARVLGLAKDHQMGCAVGFVDVDSFKQINDVHGHAAGDAVLTRIGGALHEAVGGRGIAGRIAGDEFVFVLAAKTEQKADAATRRVSDALNAISVRYAGQTIAVHASVGAAWFDQQSVGIGVEAALSAADRLMYESKRAGKARYTFGKYQPAQSHPAAA